MAGPDCTTVDVAGNMTTVLRGGVGDPALYLHGLAADVHATLPGEEWTPMLAALADRWEVIAPAAPGYNGSQGAEAMKDVEDYAFHYLDLLDALGLEKVDVIGHSFGGWLAAEFALRHPSRVRRMVLVNPLGVHAPGAAVASFFGAVAPRGIGGLGEARGVLFADPDGAAAVAALPDLMTQDQQLLWFAGLAGAARIGWAAPQFQSRALTRRLARIAVPTRVIACDRDLLVPPAQARVWAARIPGSDLVTVDDAGHCGPWEQPGKIADAVVGALGAASR